MLMNKKLEGYWLVTKEYKIESKDGQVRIIRFEKCKKAARKTKTCVLSWSYVDSGLIIDNKLDKEVKKNWQPEVKTTYWVEKKKDKETKRAILHFEDYTNISLNVLKKELSIYLDSAVAQQAKKLK